MSESDTTGFGKFVPGFDFLQNLAKGASTSVPNMPSLGAWVAPTMDVEELDKRIGELKSVQFWLDQNSRALAATVQALEVQKMTLSTLKGMDFNLGDLANAFKPKAPAAPAQEAASAPPKPAAKTTAKTAARKKAGAASAAAKGAPAAMVDPLQLWGSLTQQFQQIAANAMQEVSAQAAVAAKKAPAGTAAAKTAAKSAARKRP